MRLQWARPKRTSNPLIRFSFIWSLLYRRSVCSRIFRIELLEFLLCDLHVYFGRSLGIAVGACDLCEPRIIWGCDERQIVERQRNTTINLIVILKDGLMLQKMQNSKQAQDKARTFHFIDCSNLHKISKQFRLSVFVWIVETKKLSLLCDYRWCATDSRHFRHAIFQERKSL